ncbi:EF-hand domain - like 10 [Theobroma cacao]|uniref:Probable calcium-binding protein CML25 n=1 Tax=Theobroma cacao TaxID=3641 RepID=A0AB32VGE0_THECC|nr:PREDICTED: probable calcium-binding protein CML25 [Theobroma cacao]WRX17544.1 EF-hand domain - like 10 [Theobroma cacao]
MSCLIFLSKQARKFLLKLKVLSIEKGYKKRDPKVLLAGFDCSSSSFASMEVSSQLKQVFKLIDTNGDEKISSLELSEVLSSLGRKRSAAKKEADAMVRELDRNGDGYIDFKEFMDAVGVNTVQFSDKEDELMDAFAIFDSDKNGFISAKELQNILAGLGYERCSLSECFLMIKGVDKDGDGLINFEEFKLMMTAYTA